MEQPTKKQITNRIKNFLKKCGYLNKPPKNLHPMTLVNIIEYRFNYVFESKTTEGIQKGFKDFLEKNGITFKTKKKKKKVKPNQVFYNSRAWMQVRYKALLKHGRQCQCCGTKPPSVVLHVDHIKPRSKYPELELKLSNLQVLCEHCNLGKSNIDETDFR